MKTLCITMGNDWPLAEAEFKRVGLEVERFDAIVEDNRVLAFNKSVYECMKLSEGEDLLLFEDDVAFDIYYGRPIDTNRVILDKVAFDIHIEKLPSDFLTLHLGCNIIGTDTTVWKMPTYHSGHLAKLHNCFQSHATLYSSECVKFILDNFKYVTDEYKTEGCRVFDDWLRTEVLSLGRSYVLKPMIAYQRPRVSEIWGGFQDYTSCHKRGNEYLMKL